MTDTPKLLSREAFEADTYLRCDCHEQVNQTCDKCAIRAHIAALEAERDALQARNAQIDAENKAADFAYRQQQIAASYDGYGEPGEEDVSSNALYRGNSVGWTHSKAYNYGKSLGRVWDALDAAGIKSDGKTHCADAVLRLAAERDAAYRRGLEDAARVADKQAKQWDECEHDPSPIQVARGIAAAIRALKPGDNELKQGVADTPTKPE